MEFLDLKELRSIPCPEIMVECKNYENDLTINEYNQLSDRLNQDRGMLGFLLCRDKKDEKVVLSQCRDKYKNRVNKFVIVLDDTDLEKLVDFKLNLDDDFKINEFIEKKVKDIINQN